MNCRRLGLALFVVSSLSYAHGGRTNAEGCHTDKKADNYHCHNQNDYVLKYDRKDWGGWVDEDGDCQNIRAEILIRDSLTPVIFKTDRKCKVVSGTWKDPYTGRIYYMASDIDIDHIVPLSHAHKYGGMYWDKDYKVAFANDPENLLAVEDNANQSKGDKAPHEWMPDNENYHCKYIGRWIYVAEKYKLSVSQIEEVVSICTKESSFNEC